MVIYFILGLSCILWFVGYFYCFQQERDKFQSFLAHLKAKMRLKWVLSAHELLSMNSYTISEYNNKNSYYVLKIQLSITDEDRKGQR